MAKNKTKNLFEKGKKATLVALMSLALSPKANVHDERAYMTMSERTEAHIKTSCYKPSDLKYIKSHQKTAAQITSALEEYKERFGYNDEDWKNIAFFYGLEVFSFLGIYLGCRREYFKEQKKIKRKIKTIQMLR